MADPQPEASSSSNVASSSSHSGEGNADNPGYWCYQCRKEVTVEAREDGPSVMICSECRNGFVEPLGSPPPRTGEEAPGRSLNISSSNNNGSSSDSHGYPGNTLRRRRRRGNTPTVARTPQAQAVSLTDAFGQLYPQQLVHVLQLLGQAARANNENNSGSSDDSRNEQHGEAQQESADATNQERENSSSLQRSEAHDDGDGDHDESESEVEAALLERWESEDEDDEDDEDEWEEVGDEEGAAGQGGGDDNADDEGAHNEQEQRQPPEELPPRRNARVRREQGHNARRPTHLHHYLQELLQNLVGQNIEVRVEVPQYVGNPGDYVDARGFELLLQQLAENDNSRRGAPPAAKSAVDTLPTILIEQAHLDDGSAVCAVCKDTVCVGEPAKQMPCLHLYHADCILPWLDSRNSCPVCRFELPTDDPDYEDQKRMSSQRRSTPSRAVEHVESQQQTEEQYDAQQQSDASVSRPGSSSSTSAQDGASSSGRMEAQEEIQPPLEAARVSEEPLLDATMIDEGNTSGGAVQRRNGTPASRGRGWSLLSAAPMLSMVGIVLVICLGNHLIGGSSRQGNGGSHVQRQQPDYSSQEPGFDRIAASSSDSFQARRRWWWLPFQPR
ncbi:hypothetical protein SELMODRAFT_451322 [Selaginella moellendorffii]|uniref:RING-type E3 ubiquitin transferase n=1 Tax=Selaginella moellendorffii TaxID=88036 RepID=D8RAM6_SELML|nr:uncharacterized protein LOC9631640 [Selaginella moellendorffii]EFJ30648.1 hypothetical protein SELMODRAFT_451322 [Selaginella moellendorffii]|eukprot:XP_002968394.1 uncharacterized protein LOC9631640 [Selaginella moellendorffii]